MSQSFVITVSLLPDGQLKISGPLENPLLCYGMLERGKDIVRAIMDRPKSSIIPAPISTPPLR